VLRVDERGAAARALRLRDRVQGDRRLAAGLRAVDLDDAPLGQAAAQGGVQGEGARGDGGAVCVCECVCVCVCVCVCECVRVWEWEVVGWG
jgi:hypothetical protein